MSENKEAEVQAQQIKSCKGKLKVLELKQTHLTHQDSKYM